MNYEEFKDAILQEMQVQNGDLKFDITHVEKLQGLSYDALAIRNDGSNVSTMINLDKAFEFYQECDDFGEALSNLQYDVDHSLDRMPKIDFTMLDDYDRVKEHLEVQMIPVKGNEDQLVRLPHEVTGDIAMVYRIEMDQNQEMNSSTLMTNDMLKAYGITEEQLHADAMEYAPCNRPASFKSISDVLNELTDDAFPEEGDSPFYVATVEDNEQGAGVIMYPGFLDMACEKLGGDLYILPSSVHEVLILQDTKDFNTAEFNEMIATINAAEVKPEERLSDHAYHYDSRAHLLELATDYDKRMIQTAETIFENAPNQMSVREPMEQNLSDTRDTINCLLVQPDQYPKQMQIDTRLESLQQMVGGDIEVIYPFEEEVGVICNEEGKINGMPYNRALRDDKGEIYDILAGDFLVVGLTEEDFGSLTPEQMEKFEKTFHQPETFVQMGKGVIALPMSDEAVEKKKEVKEHAGRSGGPDR